jgi:Domain of unknown function (DUF4157)
MPRPAWAVPRVAASAPIAGVQRKVKPGDVSDAAEQEADRTAERVVSGSVQAAPVTSRQEVSPLHAPQRGGRLAAERPSGTASIYRKVIGEPGVVTTGAMETAAAHAVATKGSGEPLRPHIRHTLESHMAVDLRGVRVHEGPAAQTTATAINARAFTHQNDIWLGRGESPDDLRLIAHEAAHVVQQGAASPRPMAIPAPVPTIVPIAPIAGGGPVQAGTATMDSTTAPGATSGRRPEATVALAGPFVPGGVVAPQSGAAGALTGSATPSGGQAVGERGAMGGQPATTAAGSDARTATGGTTSVSRVPTSTAPAAAKSATPAAADGTGDVGKRKPDVAPDPRKAIGATIGAVKQRAGGQRAHPPAAAPVASAEAAGVDPAREAVRAADQQTVANVDAAAPNPDQVTPTFKSKLKETLAKSIDNNMQQPKTKAEADVVMGEGAKRANQSLDAQLASGREAAAGPIQQAVDNPVQAPAAGSAPPLKTEQAGAPPMPIPAAGAVPAPVPAEQLDMSSDRAPTDQVMAKNDVSKQQLEEGNDPAFGPTAAARDQAEKHEAGVEARYRKSETADHANAQAAAHAALATGLADIHDARGTRIGHVAAKQVGTKDQNLAAKNAVTDKIAAIKKETLRRIEETLEGLEDQASGMFEAGLRRAEDVYNDAFSDAKGGAWTWLTTWGDDWQEHIEASLRTAKAAYKAEVDRAIDEVADFVEAKLKAAKLCVADGLRQIQTYVDGLDDSLKDFGREALTQVKADFEQMVSDIDSRADKLIDKLTEQYRASYQRMQAMEEKLREENKSLWQRVYDATVGLIEKIIAFKDMLLGILSRAASVVGDIIKHPIRFLGNLIDAVSTGVNNFVSNIGEHLKQGFMEWLFGAVAETGIQLPKSFDLKGIVSLVLQVLGITYANFRARAVNLLGEKVVAKIETVAEVFQKLISEGPGALWEWIKEKIGDLKAMVIDQIQNFIIEKVIMAGVTWLIGLLNPASAFFKACKAIYDIIMFFVERGSQIIALVNAVIDSMAAIAAGSIGGAATMVENALARAIPVVIGFLASLLGVGGISEKIKQVIETVRKPINAAIDWVIGKALQLVKAAGKFVGGLFGGKETKDKKDEEPTEADPEKAVKIKAGLVALDAAEKKHEKNGKISRKGAEAAAREVQQAHPVFKSITVTKHVPRWDYKYTASPEETYPGGEMDGADSLSPETIIDQVFDAVTSARSSETHLDATSVGHGYSQLDRIFRRENVPAANAAAAMAIIQQLGERALAETTGDAISKRMRNISGVANGALRVAGSTTRINAHHIEQVSKHVGTFPETKKERTYIAARYGKAIEKWVDDNSNLSAGELEAKRAALVRDLRDQIFEEKHPNLEAPLEEVQMVITTSTAHSAGHRIISQQDEDADE